MKDNPFDKSYANSHGERFAKLNRGIGYGYLLALLPVAMLSAPGSSRENAADVARRCSIMEKAPWTRADSTAFAILRVRPDSIFVGRYFRSLRDGAIQDSAAAAKQTSPVKQGIGMWRPRGTDVFGQMADIVAVEAGVPSAVRPPSKAILVWWVHGSGCDRMVPPTALGMTPGEEVFVGIAPRPKAEWIKGIPTYDADYRLRGAYRIYDPAALKVTYRALDSIYNSPFMSAREYGEFYSLFPRGKAERDVDPGVRILTWAARHPELARKHPASWWIQAYRSIH